jgi:hypothetical protein
MRQRPLPCKYCMAEPMSSSISFATWCSVIVRLSFVDDAVLGFLGWVPPLPLAWTQSLTPCKDKRTRGSTVREERVESEKSRHACYFWFVVLWWLRISELID